MRKFLSWIDDNLLAVMAGVLIVFIPLYPKLPLFDILYGYNVRVRVEDFLVAFVLGIYIVQLLRRRTQLVFDTVSKGLFVYLAAGLVSALVAIFIIHTVPLQVLHVGKTLLHWLRRVEYFSLFFILFSSIKSTKASRIFVCLLFVTLVGVIVYGYGQKYLYWPAFSTMNREYSKGWLLYLSEHARVLSTFGGHYDLAGYLVIVLTLLWSFLFGAKKLLYKFGLGALLLGGFWLLILTASRISFGAYVVGLTAVVFFWSFKRGIAWGVGRWLVAVFLSLAIMLSFGDLSGRFLHLLRLDERVAGLQQVFLRPSVAPPQVAHGILENNIAAVTSPSDQPPLPYKPGQKPADVTGNEIPLMIATTSADGKITYVQRQRTYSQNAIQYDLSTAIRFDVTWPRAFSGFLKDPLLGSGYATLTKANVDEFTDGESTDSDFLRSLGETGLIGFLTFFGTILLMAWVAFKSLGGIKDSFLYSLAVGFIGLVSGLLVNGLLIDIFEASKVAYIFWAVSGITLGTLYLNRVKIKENMAPLKLQLGFEVKDVTSWLKNFFLSDVPWVILVAGLTLLLRTYKLDAPLADWHSWRQADTSAVTRDFVRGGINFLYPTYEDLSSIPSGKDNPRGLRYVEFPIYNAAAATVKKLVPEFNYEAAGRFTTALVSAITVLFLFGLCSLILSRRIAYLSSLVFAALPYAVFYGRTILPEPTMVMFGVGSLYFGSKFARENRVIHLALYIIFLALAALEKPTILVFTLPLIYIFWLERKLNIRAWLIFALATLVAIVPFILWRRWIGQFPEGIPASSWLFNGNGIRFKGAFWFWLFADRMGRLILGFWGLVLLVVGLIKRLEGKYKFFPILLFLGSILYLFVIATGNVQHDYYQILLLPALSIGVGVGLDHLIFARDRFLNLWVSRVMAVVCVAFMLGFGWYYIRDYYNINHPEIVEAGKKVLDITNGRSENALVIAPYDGDTAFLYQTERKGWPIMEGSIEDMIKKGADYYVSVKFDKTTEDILADSWPKGKLLPKGVEKKYILLEKNDRYVVVQLVPDKLLP
jgi:hypothetical protein